MPRPKAVYTAVSKADFYLTRQGDDELPTRRIVPIREVTGLGGPKDNAFGSLESGQLWMGGEVELFDMRLAICTSVQARNTYVGASCSKVV